MGTFQHDFVVAMSHYGHEEAEAAFEAVKEYAATLGQGINDTDRFTGLLIGPIPSVVNDSQTYFLAPDGSKEGWMTSQEGDSLRDEFIYLMTEADCTVASGSFGELGTSFKMESS